MLSISSYVADSAALRAATSASIASMCNRLASRSSSAAWALAARSLARFARRAACSAFRRAASSALTACRCACSRLLASCCICLFSSARNPRLRATITFPSVRQRLPGSRGNDNSNQETRSHVRHFRTFRLGQLRCGSQSRLHAHRANKTLERTGASTSHSPSTLSPNPPGIIRG